MTIYFEDGPRYQGATLEKMELNGYDDSDFYVLVWTHEGGVQAVANGSTRYFGGRQRVEIDATPEVQRLADEWLQTQHRRRFNAYVRDLADECQIPVAQARRLEELYGYESLRLSVEIESCGLRSTRDWRPKAQLVACKALLKTRAKNRFRSEFRRKMADQLIAWLQGQSEYDTPFSRRQWECVLPYDPYRKKYAY